jgi:hypothetical protein
MPNKLEPSLKNCNHDMLLRNMENLARTGLSLEEVGDIMDEIEEWLASEVHFAPDIWEGPDGWHKQFHTFVIEGSAGETCIARIYRKVGSLRKWQGVDLDNPKTWKVKTSPSPPKTSSE